MLLGLTRGGEGGSLLKCFVTNKLVACIINERLVICTQLLRLWLAVKRDKSEGQARDSWQDTKLGSCLDNNTPCRVGAPVAPSYRGL